MNNKIANIIRDDIKDIAWIDKLAGLTQVAKVSQTSGESKVEKRFPISCAMSYDDACKTGCYDELAPDSKYKSVAYFEDEGVTFTGRVGNKIYYESRLRLIVWLNLKALAGECGTSGDYVIDVIKTIPSMPRNVGGLISLQTTITSQAVRDVSIFSKYTYNEKQTQYLMYPYDFFALELRTNFVINTECATQPTEGCVSC